MDAESVPFMSTLLLEVILAAIMGPETVRLDVSTLDALRVPVIFAGPVTKILDVLRLDAESVLFPVIVTLSDDTIPSALKVPVMSAGPVTKRLDVLRLDAESVLFPVTVISSDDVIPAALKVPVMSAGPVTKRLAVASKLDTEILCGSLLLLSVPEVTLDAFRSDKASPEPMKSVAFTFPMTSNFCVGCVDPIPTLVPSTTTALFADHSEPFHVRISPVWVPSAGPALS